MKDKAPSIQLSLGYKDPEQRLGAMEELQAAALKNGTLRCRIVPKAPRKPPLIYPAQIGDLIYDSKGRTLGARP